MRDLMSGAKRPAAAAAPETVPVLRALRALARRGAYASEIGAAADGTPSGGIVLSPRNGFTAPVARFDAAGWAAAIAARWIAETGPKRWTLAAAGIAEVRGRVAGRRRGEGAAVGRRRKSSDPSARPPGSPVFNSSESPLAWLATRGARGGRSLITPDQLEAGERLRSDFWRAGMTPRVTARWSELARGEARRGVPGFSVEISDTAAMAQARVRAALAAVGPELAGILIDVCCHLKGLESTGKAKGWPRRTARVVLDLALTRLARHYGIRSPARSGARIRHWGSADYRPRLDGGGEDPPESGGTTEGGVT